MHWKCSARTGYHNHKRLFEEPWRDLNATPAPMLVPRKLCFRPCLCENMTYVQLTSCIEQVLRFHTDIFSDLCWTINDTSKDTSMLNYTWHLNALLTPLSISIITYSVSSTVVPVPLTTASPSCCGSACDWGCASASVRCGSPGWHMQSRLSCRPHLDLIQAVCRTSGKYARK